MKSKNREAATVLSCRVGSRVRLARVRAGITQAGLGEALGVSFQQIQKYEKGVNRISLPALTRIAEAIGISAATLIDAPEGPDPLAGLLTVENIRILKAVAYLTPRAKTQLVAFLETVSQEPRVGDPDGDSATGVSARTASAEGKEHKVSAVRVPAEPKDRRLRQSRSA